jgi:hypothetical protein
MTGNFNRIAIAFCSLFRSEIEQGDAKAAKASIRLPHGMRWAATIIGQCLIALSSAPTAAARTIFHTHINRAVRQSFRTMSGGTLFGAVALVTLFTFPAQAQDITPPVFSGVPADFNVEATSAAGAIVNFTPPTAVDAVDGPVPVTSNPVSGTLQPLGATMITFTATDLSGNTAMATTIATVQDTTPPNITAPADQSINTDAGLARRRPRSARSSKTAPGSSSGTARL